MEFQEEITYLLCTKENIEKLYSIGFVGVQGTHYYTKDDNPSEFPEERNDYFLEYPLLYLNENDIKKKRFYARSYNYKLRSQHYIKDIDEFIKKITRGL